MDKLESGKIGVRPPIYIDALIAVCPLFSFF
jgi:hypothetical protein